MASKLPHVGSFYFSLRLAKEMRVQSPNAFPTIEGLLFALMHFAFGRIV